MLNPYEYKEKHDLDRYFSLNNLENLHDLEISHIVLKPSLLIQNETINLWAKENEWKSHKGDKLKEIKCG